MRLTAVVTHEPPVYVARCVEVDAAAQGATADEAGDAFARLDALFARHARDDDAAKVVREMRDGR